MNGRMYDPVVSHMLAPDNFVQTPDFSQNFNRYSYALNNPLMFTDPDGEFIFTAIIPGAGIFIDAALWGAVISGAGYTASVAFSNGGFDNWNGGDFLKSMGIGAISGIATAGIGSAFGGVGGFGKEALRAGAHGILNGGLEELQGGSFGSGFLSGSLGSLAGSGFQAWGGKFAKSIYGTVSFSAVGGGIGAELGGGDFWRGAAKGATIGLLNHSSRLLQEEITKNMGAFMNSRDKALSYVYHKSQENGVEMGMVEMNMKNGKTRYFVTPWEKNTSNSVVFDGSKITGYKNALSRISYHTHLSYNGPSYVDFNNNTTYSSFGVKNSYDRSFVLSLSSVFEVNRYPGLLAPRGISTCRYLGPVSNWLNGNYIGF
jgi:hypothetical protein